VGSQRYDRVGLVSAHLAAKLVHEVIAHRLTHCRGFAVPPVTTLAAPRIRAEISKVGQQGMQIGPAGPTGERLLDIVIELSQWQVRFPVAIDDEERIPAGNSFRALNCRLQIKSYTFEGMKPANTCRKLLLKSFTPLTEIALFSLSSFGC
jgi:hypothetical protein